MMATSAADKLKELLAKRKQANENEKAKEQIPESSQPVHLLVEDSLGRDSSSSGASDIGSENSISKEPSTELAVPEPAKDKVVSPEYEPLKLKMRELEAQLEQQVPEFSLTLKQIHQHLAKDPASVTILSEEEIGTIVSGLERHSGITIVAGKAAGKSKSGKTQPVSADML